MRGNKSGDETTGSRLRDFVSHLKLAGNQRLHYQFGLISSYHAPIGYLHLFSAFPKVDHQIVASGQIIGGPWPWLLTTANTNS